MSARKVVLYAWWFSPFYGVHSNGGPPDIIEATSLDIAFKIARTRWSTATRWRCDGRVDVKDSQCSTRTDRGWEEQVVRSREKGTR